jgi:sugar phosphate permease
MAPLILWLGWRHAFNAIGIAGIVFAVAYFVFVPYLGRPGKADAGAAAKAENRAPMRELMKNPLLWQLMVVWFGLSCVNKGLDSWMPLYLLQQRGLDLKTVGVVAPIPFVMATIATAMGGWVMTTFFAEREKYLLIGASALTGIFLYAMYKAETIAMLITYQSVVYSSNHSCWPRSSRFRPSCSATTRSGPGSAWSISAARVRASSRPSPSASS